MMNFNIKDFSEISVDGVIPATNDFGTLEEQTTVEASIENFYTVNPVTLLISKIVGLTTDYWNEYKGGLIWIKSDVPLPVAEYMNMHYRNIALFILSKQINSLDNIKKAISISLGYPFSLIQGVIKVSADTDKTTIEQFAFRDTVPDSVLPTLTYEIPSGYTVTYKTGDVLSAYTPLISGLEIYEYLENTSWVSSYDPGNVTGLTGATSDEFTLNKNRVVAVWNKNQTKYNFQFVQKYLNRLLPKNIITLFKQS